MTQTEIKNIIKRKLAVDITRYNDKQLYELNEQENGLILIASSFGTYGTNGKLLQGRNTRQLYAIACRSSAIFF